MSMAEFGGDERLSSEVERALLLDAIEKRLQSGDFGLAIDEKNGDAYAVLCGVDPYAIDERVMLIKCLYANGEIKYMLSSDRLVQDYEPGSPAELNAQTASQDATARHMIEEMIFQPELSHQEAAKLAVFDSRDEDLTVERIVANTSAANYLAFLQYLEEREQIAATGHLAVEYFLGEPG